MACIYCTSENHTQKFKALDLLEDPYDLHLCNDCHCTFIHPQPSIEQLKQAYSPKYYGRGKMKFDSKAVEDLRSYFARKNARLIAQKLKGKGKVLDIGCGTGKFLESLLKLGDFEAHGSELAGPSIDRASDVQNVHLKIGPFNPDNFKAEEFDAVTLIHVFEHLPNPNSVIVGFKKIIKQHGYLLISFPNIDSYQARLFKQNWFHLDPPRHLHFFKPKSFVKIMEDQGFELEIEDHLHPQYNPYGMVQSILNVFSTRREILFEALKGNKSYIRKYTRILLAPQLAFLALSLPVFVVLDFIEARNKKGATVQFLFRKK